MSSNNAFSFKHAIVCRDVPNSLINGLSLDANHEPVDVNKARAQHLNYLSALRSTGLKLFEMEPDEKYPDGVFVEDTAVVIGKKVLITNPGADSRRGEAEATAKMFQKIKNEFCQDLEIHVMDPLGEATCDGGDCCFTGRELLVGLSKRTNQKGIFL